LEPAFIYASQPVFVDATWNQANINNYRGFVYFCQVPFSFIFKKLENLIVCFTEKTDKLPEPTVPNPRDSTVDDIEESWNGITGKGYHGLIYLCCGPVVMLSQKLDQLIIHLMVDIWLPLEQPLSNLLAGPTKERLEEPEPQELTFKYSGAHPSMEKTWQAATARGYLHSSDFLNLFDHGVVDKAINNLAAAFGKISDNLRKAQTGDLQNYLLVVFIGLTIISSFFLLNTTFYYGNLVILLQKAWLTLR